MIISYNKRMDAHRRKLLWLIKEQKKSSLSEASLAIGRNHAYLHQYIHRGSPRALKAEDRRRLAAFLGVEEAEIVSAELPSLKAVAASSGKGAYRTDTQAMMDATDWVDRVVEQRKLQLRPGVKGYAISELHDYLASRRAAGLEDMLDAYLVERFITMAERVVSEEKAKNKADSL